MLDSRWVESLHARLTIRYGAAWLRQWDGVPVDALRADWAEVLSGMTPERIAHGLAHLPVDYPPTAPQFRALCLSYLPTTKALPSPKADPGVVKKVLSAFHRPAGHDPKSWAYRLRDREHGGERLSSVQRRSWREALGHVGGAE